MREASVHTERT
jgi:hypothetical protein